MLLSHILILQFWNVEIFFFNLPFSQCFTGTQPLMGKPNFVLYLIS